MQDLHDNQERPHVEWGKGKQDSDKIAMYTAVLLLIAALIAIINEYFFN